MQCICPLFALKNNLYFLVLSFMGKKRMEREDYFVDTRHKLYIVIRREMERYPKHYSQVAILPSGFFFFLFVLQFTEISFSSSTFFPAIFSPVTLLGRLFERGEKIPRKLLKTADRPEPRACESNQTWKSDGEAEAGGLLLSVIQWGAKGMEFFWLTVRRGGPTGKIF